MLTRLAEVRETFIASASLRLSSRWRRQTFKSSCFSWKQLQSSQLRAMCKASVNNQDSAPINFLLIEFLIERLRTNYFLQSSVKRAGKIVDLIFAFRAEVRQAFPSFRPIFSIKIIKQTSPYNSLIGFSRFQVTPESSVDVPEWRAQMSVTCPKRIEIWELDSFMTLLIMSRTLAIK